MEIPKVNNLKLEALKSLVGELSDADKESLLELIYTPKTEPNLDNLNLRGDQTLETLSVADILRILKDIDSEFRTPFSARIYFTGTDEIINEFDDKSSHDEIGVIANCKLAGQVLLRLVRHFYVYPDEEDIDELLQYDKDEFEEVAEDFGGYTIKNFIKFLVSRENNFLSSHLLTSEFTTEIYSRSKGTIIYETDLSKVDIWTLSRLYNELYGDRLYEGKIIP
jgi:hypothetical protein